MIRRALAFSLIAVLTASACSFGLSAPDESLTDRRPDCDPSGARPILDTAGVVVFAGASVLMLTSSSSCDRDESQCDGPDFEDATKATGVGLLLPAVVYAVAAAVGFDATHQCRDAIRAHEDTRVRSPGAASGTR